MLPAACIKLHNYDLFEKAQLKLSPLSPRIICQDHMPEPYPPFLPKMSQNCCTHQVWTGSPFSHSLFYSKPYKISTDSTPIGNLWLCGLIKYNGFQISVNKSYETPYSMP